MSEMHRGVLRVMVDQYSAIEKIQAILEPIDLSIWDDRPKPMDPEYPSVGGQYVDIIIDQDLYGVSPLQGLLDEIEAIDGVVATVFVDTSSPYGVYLFTYGQACDLETALMLRDCYLKEVIDVATTNMRKRYL